MKRVILLYTIWLCGGFISALLKNLNVNSAFIYGLHFMIGYFSCLIMYWEGVLLCLGRRKEKKCLTQKN